MLLYTFYGSVFTLIGFAIFTENTTVRFHDFVHSLGYSRNMRLTNTYRSKACGASNFQIYNVLFYMLDAKDLSYYPLLLTCCSDLSNITFKYFKLLCDLLQIHLLAMQY